MGFRNLLPPCAHLLFTISITTGFKKRKDERRAKAKAIKEQLEKDVRKQLKKERKEELTKLLVDTEQKHEHFQEHMEPEKYEFDDHVVTITPMDLNAMASSVNCSLGSN